MKNAQLDLESIVGRLGTSQSLKDQLDQLSGRAAMLREIERITQPRHEIEHYIERYLGSTTTIQQLIDGLLARSGIAEFKDVLTNRNTSIAEEYKNSISRKASAIADEYQNALSVQSALARHVAGRIQIDLLLSQRLTQDIGAINGQIRSLVQQLANSGIGEYEQNVLRSLQQMISDAPLSAVAITETGSVEVAGTDVPLQDTTWHQAGFAPTDQPAFGLLAALVIWLSSLAPRLRAAFLYILLPYIISIIANINTPIHEEWWKSLRSSPGRDARKEINARAIASYQSADLAGFRFISAKNLSVHHAARQRSPVRSVLQFGKVVRLVSRQGSWSLVEYADNATQELQQGWVLSRYLTRFKK